MNCNKNKAVFPNVKGPLALLFHPLWTAHGFQSKFLLFKAFPAPDIDKEDLRKMDGKLLFGGEPWNSKPESYKRSL